MAKSKVNLLVMTQQQLQVCDHALLIEMKHMYSVEYANWLRQKSVPGTMLTNGQHCTVQFTNINMGIGSSICSGDN